MRTLLLGAAVLALASTYADARDGCGRGWFYNGRACVEEGGGYYDRGYRDDRRFYGEPRRYYGNTVRPTMGDNGQISCGNPRYTWQDGACRPYRGP